MQNKLIFYDLMGYNYPDNKEYFYISDKLLEGIENKPIKNKKLSNKVKEQEEIINKYSFLFKQIPFVKNIYICNSLSFKSVHENSDIDLFIVCKNNRIFLAKLFTWIILKLFRLWGKHEKNKFCCGFFITEQAQDLYPISIKPLDIYLAYWIAHLQVAYTENGNNEIYKKNLWIKEIIPNFKSREEKILNIKKRKGKGIFKIIIEKLLGFDSLNNIIGFIWKKRMNKNKINLGKIGKKIIISDDILKFQAPDIRKIVYLKYKSLKVKRKHKINIKEKELF